MNRRLELFSIVLFALNAGVVGGGVTPSLADDPAGAARHLGHDVGAKTLHDLIERAVNRRQRSQLLDQDVTTRDGVSVAGLGRLVDGGDEIGRASCRERA